METIAELEHEVQALMALAEQADREARPETLKIPDEIARHEKRLAKLQQEKAVIEERHATRLKQKQQEHEAKMVERKSRRDRGERVGGPDPKPPATTMEKADQYNFTDPESRIMKVGNKEYFEQSYNAQAAVDVFRRRKAAPMPRFVPFVIPSRTFVSDSTTATLFPTLL